MIFSLLFFVGCEKVDFNETEGEPETDLPEEELSDTLSVAQALYLAEYGSDEDLSAINAVGIIGYIVGAIPGTLPPASPALRAALCARSGGGSRC